jgi:hypothetical protein
VRDPVVSTLCPLMKAGRGLSPAVNCDPRGRNYFQLRRSPVCGNALKSLGSGVASRTFRCALRHERNGDGTVALALHATRSILGRVLRPTNSARTSPIPRGRGVLCDRMGFWRIGAIFAG